MKHARNRSRNRRGSALTEFAVGFPLLMVLVAGLFQYGYSFYVYHELITAIRNGARYAAVADYDSPNGSTFEELVRNVAVYGKTSPEPGDPTSAPGLSLDNVAISVDKDGAGIPISVTVSIADLTIDAVWDEVELDGKPSSTYVYQGQFR